VMLFADRFGGRASHQRVRIGLDAGVLVTRNGTDFVASAFSLQGEMVVCTNAGASPNGQGSISWLDPVDGNAAGGAIAIRFETRTCNLYATDAGLRLAAWGTNDGGSVLVVGDSVPRGSINEFVIGTCRDGGSFLPQRIRLSPHAGTGILTGQYTGACEVDGTMLMPPVTPPVRGFVSRAPYAGIAPATFIANGAVVSENVGSTHVIAVRDQSNLSLFQIDVGSNAPQPTGAALSMASTLRETNELVFTGSQVLMVGAARFGGLAFDRDVTVTPVSPASWSINPELVIGADGDQDVISAVWMDTARLVAIAGNCRVGVDGGFPEASVLCTGDGGSAFVVFVDPARIP
jgi:hypothetical protein